VVGGVIEGKMKVFSLECGLRSLFHVGVGFGVENERGRMVVVRGGTFGVSCSVFVTEFVEFTLLLNLQEEKGI